MRPGGKRYRMAWLFAVALLLPWAVGCEERVVRTSGFYTPQEGWGTKQPTKTKEEPGWFEKYPQETIAPSTQSIP